MEAGCQVAEEGEQALVMPVMVVGGRIQVLAGAMDEGQARLGRFGDGTNGSCRRVEDGRPGPRSRVCRRAANRSQHPQCVPISTPRPELQATSVGSTTRPPQKKPPSPPPLSLLPLLLGPTQP